MISFIFLIVDIVIQFFPKTRLFPNNIRSYPHNLIRRSLQPKMRQLILYPLPHLLDLDNLIKTMLLLLYFFLLQLKPFLSDFSIDCVYFSELV